MKKFETPEIKVVIFKTNDVISTSVGQSYEGSVDMGGINPQDSASQPASEFTF